MWDWMGWDWIQLDGPLNGPLLGTPLCGANNSNLIRKHSEFTQLDCEIHCMCTLSLQVLYQFRSKVYFADKIIWRRLISKFQKFITTWTTYFNRLNIFQHFRPTIISFPYTRYSFFHNTLPSHIIKTYNFKITSQPLYTYR